MTVDEIFKTLAQHMLKGSMMHQELANYYDFLGLYGYKRCHEYHFVEQVLGYRKLQRYYIANYNKLIDQLRLQIPDVIPSAWYGFKRDWIDFPTRQEAVKTGMEMWVEWQRQTKQLYERMYKALVDIEEIASANFVKDFVQDVTHELKKAQKYWLNKKAVDYDMTIIIPQQKQYHSKYKNRISNVFQKEKDE